MTVFARRASRASQVVTEDREKTLLVQLENPGPQSFNNRTSRLLFANYHPRSRDDGSCQGLPTFPRRGCSHQTTRIFDDDGKMEDFEENLDGRFIAVVYKCNEPT